MASHMMRGYEGINCSGSEKTIKECPKTGWSLNTVCTTNQTASLQCSGNVPSQATPSGFLCDAAETDRSHRKSRVSKGSPNRAE